MAWPSASSLSGALLGRGGGEVRIRRDAGDEDVVADRVCERLRGSPDDVRDVAARVDDRVQLRPSSADRLVSRSPLSFSASGKSSGFVSPRLKSVTSCPRASAPSTVARPRNFVPPRTRSSTLERYRPPACGLACGFYDSVADEGVGCDRAAKVAEQAECYARCYGDGDDNVRFVKLEPRRPRFDLDVSGEDYFGARSR